MSKLFLLSSILLLLVSAPYSSSSSSFQKGSTLKGKHLLPAHFPVLVSTFSAGAGEQTESHKSCLSNMAKICQLYRFILTEAW